MNHPVCRALNALARYAGAYWLAMLASGVAGRSVDFAHAPATWHTPLGLPDDWHKPLTNERGALLYDFGPGPYAIPLTVVEFGLSGPTLPRAQQRMESARVPVVRTALNYGNASVEVTTLSVLPDAVADTNGRLGAYERLDGISGALGWAKPSSPTSAEFRNVAWGINRPIRYRVRVDPGARRRVGLGFCESYKPRLNERVAGMHVEGAPLQVADLALTAARHAPQVFLFSASDANRDGWLEIKVEVPQGHDPNASLASIALYPPDAKPTREALLGVPSGTPDPALLRIACGTEMLAQPPRTDAMQANFPAGSAPVLTVRTGRELRVDERGGLSLGDLPFVHTQPPASRVAQEDGRWVFHFPAGTTQVTALVFSGRGRLADVPAADRFDFAQAASAVRTWWEKADVPFGRVTVGDPAIQAIVDASVRTIYQARERINGVGQFNSSFTLYRGLWTHDAVYLVELAAMLGDFARGRETLDTLFSFQNERGLIEELAPLVMFRALPLAVWSLERHARLSGDWSGVRQHWPAVLRGVEALRRARDSTLATPDAPNAGLLPAGFNDGGIAEIGSEYSSIYWAITGLRAIARGGREIERADDAAAIDRLATEFMQAFERTSQRDQRTDAHGNRYLPVRVAPAARDDVPPLAQWSVLEHHLFGEGLPLDGELMRGTLAMLEAVEAQGLPHSTGWMRDGIWAGYGGLYGHIPLLLGRHEKATDILYAFANHGSPLGSWVEEQSVTTAPPKLAGDQPHCWAAALFARLAISMLAVERAGTTHLLLSTPPEWLKPGMLNQIDRVHFSGGPLGLELRVSEDGRSATLKIAPPKSGKIELHTRSLQAAGFRLAGQATTPDTLPVAAGQSVTLSFTR